LAVLSHAVLDDIQTSLRLVLTSSALARAHAAVSEMSCAALAGHVVSGRPVSNGVHRVYVFGCGVLAYTCLYNSSTLYGRGMYLLGSNDDTIR
jgi:threonine dehydrogenase-like Zn-dependent dehydrogenase